MWYVGIDSRLFMTLLVSCLFELAQRDPVVFLSAKCFSGGLGYQGQKTTRVQTNSVFWHCRRRRQGQQKHNYPEKVWFVLALVPQASKQPLGKTTTTGSLWLALSFENWSVPWQGGTEVVGHVRFVLTCHGAGANANNCPHVRDECSLHEVFKVLARLVECRVMLHRQYEGKQSAYESRIGLNIDWSGIWKNHIVFSPIWDGM